MPFAFVWKIQSLDAQLSEPKDNLNWCRPSFRGKIGISFP